MSKERVFLSLGGNLGDPRAAMASALQALDREPGTEVLAVSSLYRTPPWGKLDQPDFLNAAAKLETELGPRQFLELCLRIEKDLKRERLERWGPRLIDLDILLFGDETVSEPGLEIPHPRMTERAFVLVPLAEVAAGHAVAGKPIKGWLSKLDTSGIGREPGGQDWWRED